MTTACPTCGQSLESTIAGSCFSCGAAVNNDSQADPVTTNHQPSRPSFETGQYVPNPLLNNPDEQPDYTPTIKLSERYRVHDELARGGMGVVYTATDTVFDRLVAVKVLAPKLMNTEAARRFVREARITGRLQHPSIPPVHDLGNNTVGSPYLAMKLIRGKTLAASIRDARNADGTMPPEDFDRLIQTFEQICLAVAFAHSKRVIHRDLKPQNVMVGAFGEIQVMDWGLAKELDTATPDSGPEEATLDFNPDPEERTMTGKVMGTLAYMPPEQARGETALIDERADVFALGAILCVILTGQAPYRERDSHLLWQKAAAGDLDDAMSRLDAISGHARLVNLAKRCLQANPTARPAHAGEVAASVHTAREWVQRIKRSEELTLATDDAVRKSTLAQYRSRGAILLMLATVGAATFVALIAWYLVSNERASAKRIAASYEERSKGDANEQFLDLEDAIALGIENGRFAPGWDGQYRDRMQSRLLRVQRYLESTALLRSKLIAIAMHDAAKERDVADSSWQETFKSFSSEFPEQAEVRFALKVIELFGNTKPPRALDRHLLSRAAGQLKRVQTAKVPHDLSAEIEQANKILSQKDIKPR